MDDIFLRELIIFLGVCAIFIGSVPMLLRGHEAGPIEAAVEAATSGGGAVAAEGGTADAGGAVQVRASKKRKARARDAAKRTKV
ncbi:MAG: hypothetical protein KC502_09815 [Myxococcales bacterium]|nr:hypothetical protein [Myxococcales bacterium]